jgi:hypothetical protein
LWSVIATTSLNLGIIILPRCQIFLDTSVTMFVSSPSVVTKDDWCVSYSDQAHFLSLGYHRSPSLWHRKGFQTLPSSFLLSSGVEADPTLKLGSVYKFSQIVGTIPTLELRK